MALLYEGAKSPKRKSPAKRRFCAKTPRAQDVAFLVFRGTTPLQVFPILPGERGSQKRRRFPFRWLRSFLHTATSHGAIRSPRRGDHAPLSDRDAQKPAKINVGYFANAKPVYTRVHWSCPGYKS